MKIAAFALTLSSLLGLVSGTNNNNGPLRKTVALEEDERLLQDANPCFWCNPIRTECIPLVDRPGRYTCICADGYAGAPDCLDVNECEESDPPVCNFEGAVCVDMEGTYKCVCDTNNGYTSGPDGPNGATFCTTAEDNCGGVACHPSATCNQSTMTCECDGGFIGDGVNSCLEATPAPISTTPGSSTPAPIAPVQTGDGTRNILGGACTLDSQCDTANAFCNNLKCDCLEGYVAPSGLGGTCEVRNFCNEGNTDCDMRLDADQVPRSVCIVKRPDQGFFQCQCNTGWMAQNGTEEGKSCIDFDECLLNETNSCDPIMEHCVNRNPPQKYFCIPATPAPTPAPTPSPTFQSCKIEASVECFDTVNPSVACDTIAQCQDCAPSKLCFTFAPTPCNSTNTPSGWISCVDDAAAFADPISYSIGAGGALGSGTASTGDEICAENTTDATTPLPDTMEVVLSTSGGATVQTVNLWSDCSRRTLTFGSVFGALTFSSYTSDCRGSWPPAGNTLTATVQYVANNFENSQPDKLIVRNFNRTILPAGASWTEQVNLTATEVVPLDPPIRKLITVDPGGTPAGTLTFDLTIVTNITVLVNATGFTRSNCSDFVLYQIPDIKAVP